MSQEFIFYAIPYMFKGLLLTLRLAMASLAVGIAVGLPLSFLRVYGGKAVKWFVIGFSEIFRCTPVLIQLFMVYYGFPQIGITLEPNVCAIIVLGLNSAAFQIEYLRSAIEAVGKKQLEAARSLGMSRTKAMLRIIVPQAIRMILPNWSNEAVSMIKNTGILYLIAVLDLMGQTKRIISKFYNPIDSYALVALFYLVVVTIISAAFNYLEKRLKIPGLILEDER